MFVPCHLSSGVWSPPEFNSCEATGTNSVSWRENNLRHLQQLPISIQHNLPPPPEIPCHSGLVFFRQVLGDFVKENRWEPCLLDQKVLTRCSQAPQKGKVLSSPSPKQKVLQHEREVRMGNFWSVQEWITLTSWGGTRGSRNHENGCAQCVATHKMLHTYPFFLQNKGLSWWSQSHT